MLTIELCKAGAFEIILRRGTIPESLDTSITDDAAQLWTNEMKTCPVREQTSTEH